MSSHAKSMSVNAHTESQAISIFEKIKPHAELIAALVSGVFILLGWLLADNSSSVSITFYLLAFVIGGFAKAKEGIEETIAERELNVEMLMIFAAIGSAIIGYWTEGAILIFIFAVSGALETYTLNKSQRELSSLMDLQPEEALRVNGQSEERVHVSELSIGDHILIKPGERVPSDGLIVKGSTTIDEAAISGESMPVSKSINSEIFAGTVNLNGAITVEITKPSNETLFQKLIDLVHSAQSEKSPSQLFIEKFEGTYVKIVLLVVLLMMFLPHFVLGWSWTETFYRAMVLLVVASPCALVASIMPATLSAISNGARKGILFKGGMHLENLSNLQAIAFDKTGTLTKGRPQVTDIIINPDLSEREVLGITASIEKQSNHPLAQAIVKHTASLFPDLTLSEAHSLQDVSGWGVKAIVNGEEWKVGKAEFVGSEAALQFAEGKSEQLAAQGKTIVFAANDHGIAALIALKDVIREETTQALRSLRKEGIFTIMLTGDSESTAQAIAHEAGIDDYIAKCLPETKVNELKKLINQYGTVAMVGDGINDAPALATANVGMAMGEGTDVALETADVVLMKNDLKRIADAVRLSRKMQRIVKQNIIFSLSVIFVLIASNFLQVLDLPLGVIGHEGSTILVILNGLRLLRS
ncbi:cadmium-translocating P-type ATPase [Rossellomorea vietnamensis]|uniref:Cadmium-translocating P-type ATPase n=1 Tax=Rossellomorea vietnamensis TaxID=218284 RepID=A0A5D4M1F1_9BACI|nr:heavy metal translocating P-type ATPase [Rossellomorea vietnamensis]TYR95327.1 cadmium-translocating P-type ATPase [Rossellomorea vietnamensis]